MAAQQKQKVTEKKIYLKVNKSDLRTIYLLSRLDADTAFKIVRDYTLKKFGKGNENLLGQLNPDKVKITKMFISHSNAVPHEIAMKHSPHSKKTVQPTKTYEDNPEFLDQCGDLSPDQIFIRHDFLEKVFIGCLRNRDKAILLHCMFKKTALSFHNKKYKGNFEIYQDEFDDMNSDEMRDLRDASIRAFIENIKLAQRLNA